MDRRAELVLYTRPRCHLCDVAKRHLGDLQRRGWQFEVVERNVEDDPSWQALYGEQIPVGELEGRKVFKFHVDAGRLEAALRARGVRCLATRKTDC